MTLTRTMSTSIVLELTNAEAKRIFNVLWRDDEDGPLISPLVKGILDALSGVGIKPDSKSMFHPTTYQKEITNG
jgi:hypothetical protein